MQSIYNAVGRNSEAYCAAMTAQKLAGIGYGVQGEYWHAIRAIPYFIARITLVLSVLAKDE